MIFVMVYSSYVDALQCSEVEPFLCCSVVEANTRVTGGLLNLVTLYRQRKCSISEWELGYFKFSYSLYSASALTLEDAAG